MILSFEVFYLVDMTTRNLRPSMAVVLPAGGLGKRLGTSIPKQLLELGNKPVFRHSLNLFLSESCIEQIILCVPKDWKDYFTENLQDVDPNRVQIVEGGAERWQSVRNGIQALKESIEYVLVHDVARPFLSRSILNAVIHQVQQSPCIVAKPCSDTVKVADQGWIQTTMDRNTIWLAQTPQCCRVDLLKDLYLRMDQDSLNWHPTDEASILEHYQIPVAIVPGDSLNDKITTQEDLELFRARINRGC